MRQFPMPAARRQVADGLTRILLVIVRSEATWRSRCHSDGRTSNEIAALRSQ